MEAPTGASIDAASGVLSWTPLLAHVGGEFDFTVRVTDNDANPGAATTSFRVRVEAVNVVRRARLDFDAPGTTGLRDGAGTFTGMTARLPGTGGSVPTNDPLLALNPAAGVLALTSSQADYNGGAGLATNRSVGLALAELGFTGAEDFAVTAEFRPLPTFGAVDQAGLFVGANGATLTRAGAILFGAQPEAYAVHTQAGADGAGRFGGALDGSDGMSVTIQRQGGVWRTFVDGVEWNPRVGGVKSEATFLDARADLVAGDDGIRAARQSHAAGRTNARELDHGCPLCAAAPAQASNLRTARRSHTCARRRRHRGRLQHRPQPPAPAPADRRRKSGRGLVVYRVVVGSRVPVPAAELPGLSIHGGLQAGRCHAGSRRWTSSPRPGSSGVGGTLRRARSQTDAWPHVHCGGRPARGRAVDGAQLFVVDGAGG